MEHLPGEFKSPENPIGVGPYFGDDGIDPDNELHVLWCDQKEIKIEQVLSWLCPPVNENKPVRVKDPNSGQFLLLYVVGYIQLGVKLLVQHVQNGGITPAAKQSVRKK